ncbi:MAG: hypothetical protein K2L00_05605, partial [Muribaculaceae bacterium]|nr:hypothetical protein [Muribaculaceae bacterium]
AKTYTPNSAAQTVNIPTTTSHITEGTRLYFTDARAQSALSGHTGDTVIHITASERTAWNAKLDKSVYDTFKSGYDSWKATVDAFVTKFSSMFEKESDGAGGYRILAKLGLYTKQFLSARGLNGDSGGGAVGNRLDSWSDYGTSKDGWVLSAKLGWDLKTRIDNLPTTSVNPYALTIQKNGTTVATYDGSSAKTANITIGWSDTASGRPSWIGASKPSYSFSEIGSKPTTLAGYGITDAKIANGVITLGSNTITPVTDISGKVDKVDGKGLSSNDFTDALLTKLDGIEEGANKYVHPTNGANTTISAANGKVLSAITVNSLGHVTSVSSKTLAAADIPTLAISKISGLQDALDSKLNASVFNDFKTLFETYFTLEDVNGVKRIKANYGFYSVDYVSARGLNSAGGSGTSFGRLDDWNNYNAKGTDALSATLGKDLLDRIMSLEGKNYLNDLAISVTGPGNAITSVSQSADKKTLIFTKGTTFLDKHQTLYTLTIQKNGTQVGTFKPNANATINLTDVASAATLSAHTGNGTVHITAAERTLWNDTATALPGKADKATTLAGYGITDAYTKTEADAKYVTLATDQTVTGKKTFNTATDTKPLVISRTGGVTESVSIGVTDAAANFLYQNDEYASSMVFTLKNTDTESSDGSRASSHTFTLAASQTQLNATLNGILSAGFLKVTNTQAVAHLMFSRGSYNYLTAPSGGGFSFVANGKGVGDATADLHVFANLVRPGTNNLVNLGDSTHRWKELYSVLGNFSGLITASAGIKIGECEITWVSGKGLRFSKGIYSEEFVSARGYNGDSGGGTASNRLDDWSKYSPSGTDVLSAKLGYGLKTRVDALEGKNYLNDLAVVVSGSGNAVTAVTQSADKKTLTFTKGATFLTSHQSLANYVTLNTAQTISGVKTFSNGLKLNTATSWTAGDRVIPFSQYDDMSVIRYYSDDASKGLTFNANTGALKAASFVRRGGTSSQFLKADGSVDSTAYLASSTYTAADVLAKLKTVDGSGSGLDADTVDGTHLNRLFRVLDANLDLDAQKDSNYNNGITYIHKDTAGWSKDIHQFSYGCGLNLNSNAASVQMLFDNGGNEPYIRNRWWSGGNGEWKEWKRLAFLSSTVEHANTLATARTLWGQSFDGSGNVSGNMTGVGTVSMGGVLHITKDDTGNYTQGIRINQMSTSKLSSIWFATTNASGYDAGMWGITATNNGSLRFRGGASSAADLMVITQGGNVGIGTSSPTQKLDVSGTAKATSFAIFGTASSSATLSSDSATNAFLKINSRTLMTWDESGSAVRAGSSYNNTFSLGTSSVRWSNLYSVLGNFSGLLTVASSIKIGDCTVSWVAGKGLHFDKGIYSDGFVSARGLNSDGNSGGNFNLMKSWDSAQNGNSNTTYA